MTRVLRFAFLFLLALSAVVAIAAGVKETLVRCELPRAFVLRILDDLAKRQVTGGKYPARLKFLRSLDFKGYDNNLIGKAGDAATVNAFLASKGFPNFRVTGTSNVAAVLDLSFVFEQKGFETYSFEFGGKRYPTVQMNFPAATLYGRGGLEMIGIRAFDKVD